MNAEKKTTNFKIAIHSSCAINNLFTRHFAKAVTIDKETEQKETCAIFKSAQRKVKQIHTKL